MIHALEAIYNSLVNDNGPLVDEQTGEIQEDLTNEAYALVGGTLGISNGEAEMLAAILDGSVDSAVDLGRLARDFGCTRIHMLSRKSEIDSLIDKRLVRTSIMHGGRVGYFVPLEVMNSLQKGEKPSLESLQGLSCISIIRRMNSLLREAFGSDNSLDALKRDIKDIIDSNPDNEIVREYNAFTDGEEIDSDLEIIFWYMVVRSVAFHEKSFNWFHVASLFEDTTYEDSVKSSMESGFNALFEKGLVEFDNAEGIADTTSFRLTDKARKTFVNKYEVRSDMTVESSNLVRCSAIAPKKLFYNEGEDKQIARLEELLQKDNFLRVTSRLEEKGFRKGFCCLLYGEPGTGKTESVYQIARSTGRDIFYVDASELRSKWVGEGEKKMRELFREYRDVVRSSELAPILLFNEADAVFGIRKKGAEKSTDKMENTLQNILLQEMESLEGILIATTNLSSNFDSAFERRFLYKVNLSSPGQSVRASIWESLADGISHDDALALASEYEFSGGQIENISRKMAVDYILSGDAPCLESIRSLCSDENIKAAEKRRPVIGFHA